MSAIKLIFSYYILQPVKQFAGFVFRFAGNNKRLLIGVGLALFLSDLLLIRSYSFLVVDKNPPHARKLPRVAFKNLSLESYKDIWDVNIFHRGPIPFQLQEEKSVINLEPVQSSLPFKLKGTIVHANSNKSVATIQATGKTLSYSVGDIIAKQAEIRDIQRFKVIFLNQNNSRMEYIMIAKEHMPFRFASPVKQKKVPKQATSGNSLVTQTGLNRFQVKRSDIRKQLQNLPEILNQARVDPHPEGFRFSYINKGSWFENLGFQKGDIIKAINGEPVVETVTSPEDALEMFHKLKWESGLNTVIKRDDKDITYEYTILEDAPMR